MAYRLKSVRYQKSDKHILLQNENGPCPLLAAANALLLRGSIRLPPSCIRAGAASLDDVCNMLAEEALTMSTIASSKESSSSEEHSGASFHLNELLTIFPTLQDGMDVNPKFTQGVTGVEYTSNLTVFELLRIELVHGWLLDPQDVNMIQRVGSRTYNELIEVFIRGTEATARLDTLQKEIADLEEQCGKAKKQDVASVATAPPEAVEDFEVVVAPTDAQMEDEAKATTAASEAPTLLDPPAPSSPEAGTNLKPPPPVDLTTLQKELAEKKELQSKLEEDATTGSLIDNFLQHTSHQLTTYGLMELYKHVEPDALCVFFRNNHFCTLTKHDGVLYLLVTDLGYGSVSEIMWEKLDAIDGDTEYTNPSFGKSSLHSDLLPPPSEESFERLLAQRGQNEVDYQLALQMAENPRGNSTHGNSNNNAASLEEQEGELMAAVTEASLLEYNQGMTGHADSGGATVVAIPGDISGTTSTTSAAPPPTQEEVDRLVAMNVQAQLDRNQPDEASLALAHQLQREEYQRSGGTNRATTAGRRNNRQSSGKSACVIS